MKKNHSSLILLTLIIIIINTLCQVQKTNLFSMQKPVQSYKIKYRCEKCPSNSGCNTQLCTMSYSQKSGTAVNACVQTQLQQICQLVNFQVQISQCTQIVGVPCNTCCSTVKLAYSSSSSCVPLQQAKQFCKFDQAIQIDTAQTMKSHFIVGLAIVLISIGACIFIFIRCRRNPLLAQRINSYANFANQ